MTIHATPQQAHPQRTIMHKHVVRTPYTDPSEVSLIEVIVTADKHGRQKLVVNCPEGSCSIILRENPSEASCPIDGPSSQLFVQNAFLLEDKSATFTISADTHHDDYIMLMVRGEQVIFFEWALGPNTVAICIP